MSKCNAMRPNRSRVIAFVLVLCAGTSVHAQTSCNATNRFTLDWDAQTPKNTALGTGARTFTVTNALGASVVVTMTFAGDTTHYTTGGAGQAPNISVQNVGGIGAGQNTLYLATDFVGYTTDIGTVTNVAVIRFGFSPVVRDVGFTILDIDYAAAQYRDLIRINGSNAGTYVPAITTPYGNNNTGNPGVTAPGVTYVGPGTTLGVTLPSGDLLGTGSSSNADSFANINARISQPITQAEIRYGNGPASTMTGTPGLQSISVHDFTFCPMPTLAVTKSATPATVVVTDPNRFTIPGANMDYTLTVANSGGSTVDAAGATVADPLPANVTFYNGDIDLVTAGTQNFTFNAGTSGLTLGAANITYLDAGGSPITPAAGYDPLVRTVRYQPQGTMTANSNYSVTFRTRVN